jgi:hypothetical protein
VIVVAHWQLETTSHIVPHQINQAGELMILETVTDKDGRFYFPAWGPKWHLGWGELTDRDPGLIFFKTGYKYLLVSNSQYSRPAKYSDVGKPSGTESKPTGSKRISFWSGERIGLERFKGTQEEYAEHVYKLDGNFDRLRDGEGCEWIKMPRMLVALHRMREHFDAKRIKVPGWQIGARIRKVTDVGNQKKCGSAEVFFRSYLP